ncbi:NUDIX hydrolase [Reinekea sp.]|uniref:NUDIX hydrolase n=1 Tax=Reinekea sp. TaxID=1970455 RepID=UPI002A80FEF5|nr:NUDIX hydrolase [Reinekea sp.]
MNFCPLCGYPVEQLIPKHDNRLRHVCSHCHTVHYHNPRLITGTLPLAPDGRLLLCCRNIEPRKDYWTLPGGFMENGETTVAGALRETYEEARVAAVNPRLLSVISLPAYDQIHLFYLVDMPDFSFATTPESHTVQLFALDEIPWERLAFRTVKRTLEHFLEFSSAATPPVLNDHIQL